LMVICFNAANFEMTSDPSRCAKARRQSINIIAAPQLSHEFKQLHRFFELTMKT
jgi:hypothetical protein